MICTECFLQIKQPLSGGPAVCPFCVAPEFGVVYTTPKVNSTEGDTKSYLPIANEKRKPLDAQSSEVVTVDIVRPNGRRNPPPVESETFSRRLTINGSRSTRSSRGNSTRRATQSYYTDIFEQEISRPRTQTVGRATSSITPTTSTTSHRRRHTLLQPSSFSVGDHITGSRNVESDLEQLMLMEAIRLSLLDQEISRQQNPSEIESSDPRSPSASLGRRNRPNHETRQNMSPPRINEEPEEEEEDDDDDDEAFQRAIGSTSPNSEFLIDLVRRHGGSPSDPQSHSPPSASSAIANSNDSNLLQRSTSTTA